MPEQIRTRNFAEALSWLREFEGEHNYAVLAGEPVAFKMAVGTDDGFAGLWEMESGPWILGLGKYQPDFIPTLLANTLNADVRVTIPRTWTTVALEKRSEWNFFLISSPKDLRSPNRYLVEELTSNNEINKFIDACESDPSTRPGNPEILFWHGIRGAEHELLAIGAAVRWKNGATMLVSIATHPLARGKSMAQEVTASLAQRVFKSGSPVVGLGVWAHNAPAIRAYEKVGFILSGEFVSGPLHPVT
jgi:ribosomal protein S18 acetylase RimI-like enzyme